MITPLVALLGTVAGVTIFFGLPVAVMKRVSAKAKGFLNAITIGVLIFILIEVLPSAKGYTEDAVKQTILGTSDAGYYYMAALIGGLVLGIFGLVAYEMRFIRIRRRRNALSNGATFPQGPPTGQSSSPPRGETSLGLGEAQAAGATPSQVLAKPAVKFLSIESEEARRIAFSIAVGIGAHNFTEGLAIGQAFSLAQQSLSYLLILGFAIHNSTEGFGIAAPMAGYRPSYAYLIGLGLIGGLPTLLGTLAGAAWQASPLTLTFFFALAAGALIYIISGMFYVARRQTSNELFMLGLFLGFMIAYVTDLWLATMGAA